MIKILIISPRREDLSAFSTALAAAAGVTLLWAPAFEPGIELVKTERPEAVVLDAALSEKDGKDLLLQLLQINVMLNTAVISPLKEADFHERTEGLGVLARLPFTPAADDAARLLKKLSAVGLKF